MEKACHGTDDEIVVIRNDDIDKVVYEPCKNDICVISSILKNSGMDYRTGTKFNPAKHTIKDISIVKANYVKITWMNSKRNDTKLIDAFVYDVILAQTAVNLSSLRIVTKENENFHNPNFEEYKKTQADIEIEYKYPNLI